MATQAIHQPIGSESTTDGVHVHVTPQYASDQSDPESGQFVFTYRITIVNEGDRPATLLSRHWVIVDADGERNEVRGLGVVGRQPYLPARGGSFEYTSFCHLRTPWGTMEGRYELQRDPSGSGAEVQAGERFDVRVERFYLVAPAAAEL